MSANGIGHAFMLSTASESGIQQFWSGACATWCVAIRDIASVFVSLFDRLVMAMNPYEANLSNTAARVHAWVRGMLRRYRQPLLALAAASAVTVVAVSATRAPAQLPQAADQPARVQTVADSTRTR